MILYAVTGQVQNEFIIYLSELKIITLAFIVLTLVKSSWGCDVLVIQANFDLWLHLRLRIQR